MKPYRNRLKHWKFIYLLIGLFACAQNSINAQERYIPTHEDSTALEDVIVERYYEATEEDCADTTGGFLPRGSVTYRIFIDMKPGYALQSVFGNKYHEMYINTTTSFFNNIFSYAITGYNFSISDINKNSVALDSWITLNAVTRMQSGVRLSEDPDGNYLNRNVFKILNADGMTHGNNPILKIHNLGLEFVNDMENPKGFSSNNGSWYCLEGTKGPTSKNQVLVAQLTTNGILSFKLNVQILTPSKQKIVFVSDIPTQNLPIHQIYFQKLKY